jgi:phosphohistidine phosphatase SixA
MMAVMRKEYARLRRRPFLMPLWLPVFGMIVVLAFAVWLVLSASTTLVMVVRHAEAVAGAGEDPLLSADGEARAQRLAALMTTAQGFAPDGIVVSGLRRTQETARPLAAALGVPVVVVEESDPRAVAERALAEFQGQRVLIIGHSNTVPAIVQRLSREAVPAMSETEFGTLYAVAVPRFSRPAVARIELP